MAKKATAKVSPKKATAKDFTRFLEKRRSKGTSAKKASVSAVAPPKNSMPVRKAPPSKTTVPMGKASPSKLKTPPKRIATPLPLAREVAPSRKMKGAPKKTTAPATPKIKKVPPETRTALKKTATAIEKTPPVQLLPVQLPTVPKTGGAIVGGMDPCTCGDSPEEHGRDPRYPGSTSCNAPGCEGVAYEADPEAHEADHGSSKEDLGNETETHEADPGSSKEDLGNEAEAHEADPGSSEEAIERHTADPDIDAENSDPSGNKDPSDNREDPTAL